MHFREIFNFLGKFISPIIDLLISYNFMLNWVYGNRIRAANSPFPNEESSYICRLMKNLSMLDYDNISTVFLFFF